MRLFAVQHGEAKSKHEDPDRPLSIQGRIDVLRLAPLVATAEVSVPRILHSGKTRAKETAELLDPLFEEEGVIEETHGIAPKDSPEAFLKSLDENGEDLLITSHMPFLSHLVSPWSRALQMTSGSASNPVRSSASSTATTAPGASPQSFVPASTE